MPRKRQSQLGPAPLASFDRGLSSECNSIDEGLGTIGQTDNSNQTGRYGHIGVLCQTSIMEETAVVIRTRSIACQTDRSALRDGVRGASKPRKNSQSQTSFDQDISEAHPQVPTVHFQTSSRPERFETQESLQPEPDADLRAPSPTRPSTLDLSKKQKKPPTNFNKVQKMDASSIKSSSVPPDKVERKRSFLSKKASVVSAASGTSEKSLSSSFRSPFNKKRDDTGSASSRSVSPMLQIRQRIASLSPRRKKKNIAKTKLEALLTRTGTAAGEGTDEYDGINNLSVDSAINPDRPGSMTSRSMPSHSLSPKPSRNKKDSHALNKLHALIDRTRMVHTGDANHEHALTTNVDIHQYPLSHSDDSRRRSKSTPPEPEPFMRHRLSLGAVWGAGHHEHGHHGHGHHAHHGHVHPHTSIISKSPSNPPSPFEEKVIKKFSIQEDDDSPDEGRRDSPTASHSADPSAMEVLEEEEFAQNSPPTDHEEEKKFGETLLTVEEQDEESGAIDLLDKVLKEKAQEEQILLRKKVLDDREKRQTFRTAPVDRPRSQTREIPVVDLNVYVVEAEKQTTPSPTQRIKLNLHLNQDHSIDEDPGSKPLKDRQADPENWRNFCEQGLLNKRRARIERGRGSEIDDDSATWADFNHDKNARRTSELSIPVIIETAWTPQEHRVINFATPSPSMCWEPANEGTGEESDNPAPVSNSPSFDDFSGNAFTQTNSSSMTSITDLDHVKAQHDDSASEYEQADHEKGIVITIEPASTESPNSAGEPLKSMEKAEETVPDLSKKSETTPPALSNGSPAPVQITPIRKAPPAPVRKAPPPPPAKVSVPTVPTEYIQTDSSTVETDYSSQALGNLSEDPAHQEWPAAPEPISYDYNYDASAYSYPENYTADNGYYAEGYYNTWQESGTSGEYQQETDSTQYYTDNYYNSAHEAVLSESNTTDPTSVNEYRINENGVSVVLGSRADPTGHDVIMSDPSAIDIVSDDSPPKDPGNASAHVDNEPQHVANLTDEQVESSPLLEEDADEDAATVIWHPDATAGDLSSVLEATSQAVMDTHEEIAVQSKHRRLSKVPYTSLDVEDTQEDDTIRNVPEEETVEPLLQNAADTVETEQGTEEDSAVVNQCYPGAEEGFYDPAIYDPAGTGYDINSQEYYDYYYGGSQYNTFEQPANPENNIRADAQIYPLSTDYTTSEQPPDAPDNSYQNAEYYSQYSYEAPAEQADSLYAFDQRYSYDPGQGSSVVSAAEVHDPYYDQAWSQQNAESSWPTFNAYVPPEAGVVGAQYAETSSEDESPPFAASSSNQAISGLPKERLFDDNLEDLPYGNLRPEPKKKDGTATGYAKVAKGLKPSKKKIFNLMTKGKYSSGKKKDVFAEMEENYSGPPITPYAGPPTSPSVRHVNTPVASEQWQEYQNLTSRVQETVGNARQKITPLQTPTTPTKEVPTLRENFRQNSSNVDDLLVIHNNITEDEPVFPEVPKKGAPSRPPPPKGKPGRPPPPKKMERPEVSQHPLPDDQAIAQTTTALASPPPPANVLDELADFFSSPIPATAVQATEKKASSSSKKTQDVPVKLSSVPKPVPAPTKVILTDIKSIARPKAGVPRTTAPLEITKVPETFAPPVRSVSTEPPLPAAVPSAKTSNVDDLLGLFDEPPVSAFADNSTKVFDIFSATDVDPFDTEVVQEVSRSRPENAAHSGSVVDMPGDGFGDSGYYTQPSVVSPVPRDDPFAPPIAGPQSDNEGFEADFPPDPTSSSATQPMESPAFAWSHPENSPFTSAPASAHLVDESPDPWGTSSVAPPPPPARPAATATSMPPPVPLRPPLPPRPAALSPSPARSRKEMFLDSSSQESDATFVATFGHTQDESPNEEPTTPEMKPPASEANKVVSQVESMLVRSQESPLVTRKEAQNIPPRPGSANAWEGENPWETSAPTKPPEESDILELIGKYKANAPEKIDMDANALDDSFFDPFATIVPEESPLPPPTSGAVEDSFDVWETPQRPETLLTRKPSSTRRGSVQSNTSRRTSSSVQTPLYDEDDSQPMPEFTWDHPQTSWDLLLRCPPKKTLTGNRYWKQTHMKLTDTVLQLYNKSDETKPFHELPLQGSYMIAEISIQPLDVFTKIHTTKLEYVFYKERVGIRPGQIPKITKGQITKLGLPLEHASQTTELLKFGSLKLGVLKDFVHAVEDILFRTPMIRERRPMTYKQEEVQAHVIDEFTAKVDKSGIISDRRGRVRVFCLCFLSDMPEVEFGLNDIVRRGKEVVGRHDILPIYTEEWIRMENVELHHCISKEEYEKSKMIKFIPPDGCFFELVRFRVRPPKNRELPLAVKAIISLEGYKVMIRMEAMTTGYYTRKRAQPCDDIQVRLPIPEPWIYLFRTEKLFGYGSKHSSSRKAGLIKGMSDRLKAAGGAQMEPSIIEVSSGSARYEHVYRALVWRISRLPKEGQGAYANHQLTCRLDLNAYDTMPERFEPNAEVEFTMPAATASHTTLRSISATCDDPPEKWVKYLAKYEYTVEIDYKIDRGEVQLYGSTSAEPEKY